MRNLPSSLACCSNYHVIGTLWNKTDSLLRGFDRENAEQPGDQYLTTSLQCRMLKSLPKRFSTSKRDYINKDSVLCY